MKEKIGRGESLEKGAKNAEIELYRTEQVKNAPHDYVIIEKQTELSSQPGVTARRSKGDSAMACIDCHDGYICEFCRKNKNLFLKYYKNLFINMEVQNEVH